MDRADGKGSTMQDNGRMLAVVTGGSNGIGYELARQFASNGYDVLIAAQEAAHLTEAAHSLGGTGARIETHASDLSTEDGVNSLYGAMRALDRPVDVVCVNAGIGLGGAFVTTDLQRELKMIDLNVRGSVQLTKLVLKDMVARDSGKLLFTSSIAATMPDPFEAVYGATKVFLRWFGEALRNELKDTNVGVTVLMPSVTDTNFFNRAEMLNTKAGASDSKDDPAVVAQQAFEALQKDQDKIVPKVKNKVLGAIADMLPDAAAAQVHRGMSEPGTAQK
jgi:short-subunit dehydrogenase